MRARLTSLQCQFLRHRSPAVGGCRQAGGSTRAPGPAPGVALARAKLSVDEALYLAKEAGYWTTREAQLQIVRSPPFSPKERPFLIENFFELADSDIDAADLMPENADGAGAQDDLPETEQMASPAIHAAIQKYFRPGQPNKFWHNSEEWLVRAEGRGTRKRASAHALLCRGTGVFKVNGESDMFARWPHIYHRFDVCQPFKLTNTAGVYDVFVEVCGGGLSGQAGATRLAVARALLSANPACHDALQRGFCLFEDMRQKMSKMPGKAGRRKSFPWTKR